MLIHSAVITGSVQLNNTDVSSITNVAGFATTSSVDSLVVKTGSYASTSSVNELQSKTGSYATTSSVNNLQSVTGSYATTSSFGAYTSSNDSTNTTQNTRLSTIESVTGSYATTSSVNNLQSVTGSYATTGSNQFNGNQSISGSITSNGTITAQTLVVQTVTSSIEFVTGSTRNGSSTGNTHQFTGSVLMSGSLTGTSATFRVSDNRNLAIKYDTNITLSGQADSGAPENLRIYADTFKIFTSTTTVGLTERLTISNTGNVGIGNTSPEYRVDLCPFNAEFPQDVIRLGVYNGPSGGGGNTLGTGIIWKTYYSGYTRRSAGIVQIAENNYFRAALAFYTNNNADQTTDWSERMRINSSGTVYINATSGGYSTPRLYIDNGATTSVGVVIVSDNAGRLARFNNRDYNDTNTGSSIRFGLGSGTGNTYAVINAYQAGESTTSNLILNQSGGNVGIGLSDPLGRLSTLGGAVQIMGDYVNHQTIIKSTGHAGSVSGELTITIPQMSNASSDGYGGYSCEVYFSAYNGQYCHVWFSGYNNGGIAGGEVTILRSSGGYSVSQTSTGANNQGFIFVINYPGCIHPTARIIFNKGGSVTSTAHPANSITAVFS